ncbi:porphobilinogen synthase [bacterium]|nr:porphobilinogen synthase [bacterium]
MSQLKNHPVYDLPLRMRRLRRNPPLRSMLQETRLRPENLIAPLFVKDLIKSPEPVKSMPGVHRLPISGIVEECRKLYDVGIVGVALFPCNPSEIKDPYGSGALDPSGLVPRTIEVIKREIPEMIVIADVALDPFTSHGHDGVLNRSKDNVDNDATLNVLTQMARILAEAGADWVAPSDMMDGRIGAIRETLDGAGLSQVAILAYSAKFNSAYYGPFRDAVGSQSSSGQPYLDKGTYQLNPGNPREAVRDALLDEEEGADILMVKPAGPYLDIISQLRQATKLPLAAYQVSGEYAQIHAAANLGLLDLERVRDESILAIRRSGADLILTYFALEMAREMGRAS